MHTRSSLWFIFAMSIVALYHKESVACILRMVIQWAVLLCRRTVSTLSCFQPMLPCMHPHIQCYLYILPLCIIGLHALAFLFDLDDMHALLCTDIKNARQILCLRKVLASYWTTNIFIPNLNRSTSCLWSGPHCRHIGLVIVISMCQCALSMRKKQTNNMSACYDLILKSINLIYELRQVASKSRIDKLPIMLFINHKDIN